MQVPIICDHATLISLRRAVKDGINNAFDQVEAAAQFVEENPPEDSDPMEYCQKVQFLHILTLSMHNLYRTGVRDKLLVDIQYAPHHQFSFENLFHRPLLVKHLLTATNKIKYLKEWRKHLKFNGINTRVVPGIYNKYGNFQLEMCSIRYLRACASANESVRAITDNNKLIFSEQALDYLDNYVDKRCREYLETEVARGYGQRYLNSQKALHRFFSPPKVLFNPGLLYRNGGYCYMITHESTDHSCPIYNMQSNDFQTLLMQCNLRFGNISGVAAVDVPISLPTNNVVLNNTEHSNASSVLNNDNRSSTSASSPPSPLPINEDRSTLHSLCSIMFEHNSKQKQTDKEHIEASLALLAQYLASKPEALSLYNVFIIICK